MGGTYSGRARARDASFTPGVLYGMQASVRHAVRHALAERPTASSSFLPISPPARRTPGRWRCRPAPPPGTTLRGSGPRPPGVLPAKGVGKDLLRTELLNFYSFHLPVYRTVEHYGGAGHGLMWLDLQLIAKRAFSPLGFSV